MEAMIVFQLNFKNDLPETYKCQIPAVLWLGTADADNWQVLWVRCNQSTNTAKQHKTCGNNQQLLTLFRAVKNA